MVWLHHCNNFLTDDRFLNISLNLNKPRRGILRLLSLKVIYLIYLLNPNLEAIVTALNCGYSLKIIKIINQFFFIIKIFGFYNQASALAAGGPRLAAPPLPTQA
jgi:hypothetical protein